MINTGHTKLVHVVYRKKGNGLAGFHIADAACSG